MADLPADGPVDGPADRVVQASRVVRAGAATLFELIADPSRQPSWDGNDNLGSAPEGQRVRAVGDVFEMVLTGGAVRHNRVVELVEGRLIAWCPAEPGAEPPGHLWRWELEPIDDHRTVVTHTYDWTRLDDPLRLERARRTTPDRLRASLDRLAAAAEGVDAAGGNDLAVGAERTDVAGVVGAADAAGAAGVADRSDGAPGAEGGAGDGA